MPDPWGRTLLRSDELVDLMYRGLDITALDVVADSYTDTYNESCRIFNKVAHLIQPLADPVVSPEDEHARRSAEWFVDPKYKSMDVRASLLDRCENDVERARVSMEMQMFEERGLTPLLQLMFALVDHFRLKGIVWGVGRGSSCASYCLYLIGVHKIDSILYDLDIGEFLK